MQADVEISPEKDKDLEPLIENHKTHITRLEQVMRLLENDQVSSDICEEQNTTLTHHQGCWYAAQVCSDVTY